MSKELITIEQVEKVAKLSKLDITGQEEKFTEMFSDTLKKIQDLNELDTSNVEPTFQVTGLTNIFQKDDENEAILTKEAALKNTKDVINGLFSTKGVFDRE